MSHVVKIAMDIKFTVRFERVICVLCVKVIFFFFHHFTYQIFSFSLDLLDSLMEVRKMHNNSLNGIDIKTFIEEMDKKILKRYKRCKCKHKYIINVKTILSTFFLPTHSKNFSRYNCDE